jgi:hypothetical protein
LIHIFLFSQKLLMFAVCMLHQTLSHLEDMI